MDAFGDDKLFSKQDSIYMNPKILFLGTLIGIFLSCLIFLLFLQPTWQKQQKNLLQTQKTLHAELLEATRKRGMVTMMSNLLETVNKELDKSPKQSLSEQTIGRIAALSEDLDVRPYHYFEADTSRDSSYSIERGQLFWQLYQLQLDSITFEEIKEQTTFARADLEGKEMPGINLSGADLRGANFKKAILDSANFQGADLRAANFWGAKLDKADFRNAKLNQADLSWAELHYADFREADCKGSALVAAKLNHADLRGTHLHYSFLSGALFNEADLEGAIVFYTDLERASFRGANLYQTDIRDSYLHETVLTDANLQDAKFNRVRIEDANWLSQLSSWNAQGVAEIQKGYLMEKDKTGRAAYTLKELP